MKTVLVINSSGRNEGSVTRNITQQIEATLQQQKSKITKGNKF